jgi:hypothetical protein
MASVITVAELRAALGGISSSLYSDAVLTDIIDSSEAVVGSMLVTHSVAILEHASKDNVWTNWTDRPHKFYIGQSLTVTDSHHPGVTGTKTVLEIPNSYSFTFTQVHADFDRHWTIPSGTAAANTLTQYDSVSEVEEAILAVAIDIFQSRVAPGGVQQGLEFSPAPYKMGVALIRKVRGLLGKHIDVESVIG